MSSMRLGCVFLLVLFGVRAEHIFPAREGVSWYGSNTVWVGHYAWPPNREPLGVYNGGASQLVEEYDYQDIRCDVAANTCTTRNIMYPWGGLPTNTEVKFGTTGQLPGGLSSWQTKSYYIREWSGNTFKLAAAPDGPEVDLDDNIHGNGKHGMSFAGYSHVMSFRASVVTRISCDPQTDTCTSEAPHRLKENSTFFVSSPGRLPAGLRSFWDSRYQKYCFVEVDSTKFQIKQPTSYDTPCTADSSKLVDIQDAGEGVQYMYAGGVQTIYIQSMDGYPAGTVLTWRRNATVMYAAPYNVSANGGYGATEASNFYTTLIAKVPAVTPPGDYRIVVNTSEKRGSAAEPNSFTYTLHAAAITPVRKDGPTSYPPIPGLSSSVIPGRAHRYWENIMTASSNGGGAAAGPTYRRCISRSDADAPQGYNPENAALPYSLSFPSINTKVWFYNDQTYFKIARYTGDYTWANCGLYIAKTMKDRFLNVSPSVAGYYYFPRILQAAYEWTSDASYKDAIVAISEHGNNFRGEVHDFAIREHAFAFERQLARQAVTGEPNYHLSYYADAAIGHLYELAIDSPARTFNEPFMLGLAMRPLIAWYKMSHDERVPVVIKLVLDKLWTDWYDQTKHHFYYNPEPEGLRCTNTATPANHCRIYTSSLLNNLVSPAFAWYWRLTGDDTYRQRGDDMFAYVFQDGDPYYPKEWSQVYYWSWDFVAWRKGEQAAVEPDARRHIPAPRR
jgi:hypothetical protein